jgi:hypothetical protein
MEKGHIYRFGWPQDDTFKSDDPIIITIIDRSTISAGRRCVGVLYLITQGPGILDPATMKTDIQQIQNQFWSTILQSPFKHCPIAVAVTPATEILLPQLPMLLKAHEFHLDPSIEFFNSAKSAIQWLKSRSPNSQTPATFSARE